MTASAIEVPVSIMAGLQEVRLHLLLDCAIKSISTLADLIEL